MASDNDEATPPEASEKPKTTKNPVSSLRKPRGDQTAMSPGVAAEIRTAAARGRYSAIFGPNVPDATAFATGLEQANAASAAVTHAEQQAETARATRNHTWDATFVTLVDPFKAAFDVALASNPAVADEFPLTTAFLRTNSSIGKRSANTRAANKAVKDKAGT